MKFSFRFIELTNILTQYGTICINYHSLSQRQSGAKNYGTDVKRDFSQLQYQQHSAIQKGGMNIEQSRQSKLASASKHTQSPKQPQNPLGKYKLIMAGYDKKEPLLTLGPNCLIFGFMFSLINFWTICLLARLSKFDDVRPFHLILTVSLVFLDVSWILTAFINPGISVPTHEEGGEYCELCESNNDMEVVKKTGRFHCQECDICIDERHSHYKVVGGCVGRNNLIAFKVLLLAFFLWGLSMVTIVPLVNNF